MSRRAFVTRAVVATVAVVAAGASRKYGYVDVKNCHRVTGMHSADVRVLLDGTDVSSLKCMAMDDAHGFVETLRAQPGDEIVVDVKTRELKRHRLTGRVELLPKAASS